MKLSKSLTDQTNKINIQWLCLAVRYIIASVILRLSKIKLIFDMYKDKHWFSD